MGLGGIVVRNDVRSGGVLHPERDGERRVPSLTALEDAVLRATADSSAKASGGAHTGREDARGQRDDRDQPRLVAGRRLHHRRRGHEPGSGAVAAANTSQVDAKTLSSTSSGETAVGVVLAFNTVGWQSQNVLFNTLDALVGSTIGTEQPAQAKAYIQDSAVNSGGDVTVTAESDVQLNATVGNESTVGGGGSMPQVRPGAGCSQAT